MFPKQAIARFQQTINNPDRIESLDYLRGIAITMVVFTHFQVIELDGIGVDLFFVLSGFLVSRGFVKALDKKEAISYRTFYIKRFTKIVPSFYFFILAGTALAYIFIKPIAPEQVITLSELPQYLLFYRNYAGPPPRLTFEHIWSLCVEEHFYLLLPLLFIGIQKFFKHNLRYAFVAVCGIIAAGIAFKMQALVTDIAEWPTYTHNRIDAFGWGILLTMVFHGFAVLRERIVNNRTLAIAGILLLTVAVYFKPATDPHQLLLRTIAPFAWTLIIAGSYNVKLKPLKPFRYIAYFSYNIYLWHFFILIPVVYYLGAGLAGFTVYVLLTAVLAILCTFYIEDSFLRKRTQLLEFFRKRKPEKDIAPFVS